MAGSSCTKALLPASPNTAMVGALTGDRLRLVPDILACSVDGGNEAD